MRLALRDEFTRQNRPTSAWFAPHAGPGLQLGFGGQAFEGSRRERLDAGEQIVVVDVRTDGEVASGTLPNAKHIPLHELEARWQELKEANEIVCYCAAGMRSLKAAQLLREKGLFNATSMEGGINAWREIGGATVLPD